MPREKPRRAVYERFFSPMQRIVFKSYANFLDYKDFRNVELKISTILPQC